MWKYSEILMDHFMNPRNSGELEHPDGHSQVGSPQCGDAMTLDIEVDEEERISNIRFMTFGCAGAIAAASALTEIAKGKTLDEAVEVRNSQIVEYLGGMPAEKYHCSVMGHDALAQAVEDYIEKKESTRKELEAVLSDMPVELREALSDGSIDIDHIHPAWVRIGVGSADPERTKEILSRLLSERTGRLVEIRIVK